MVGLVVLSGAVACLLLWTSVLSLIRECMLCVFRGMGVRVPVGLAAHSVCGS